MSPIQLSAFSPRELEAHPQTQAQTQTRREKSESLLTQVLPTAISLGIEGSRGASARTQVPGSSSVATTVSSVGGLARSAAPAASSALGILGGIMGATNLALSWGRSTPAAGAANGMAVGAAIGTVITPGVGTAIGAAVGTVLGGLIGCIKNGKHRDQQMRDSVREYLVSNQVLAPDYTIGLANGSRYNIGVDGGPKREFGGRRPFEVDFNNPLAHYAVSWLNPLIDLLSQGNEKVKTDFVGYFANAATSNATSLNDVRSNVNSILYQFGVSDEQLFHAITQAAKDGRLPIDRARIYLSGINERRDTAFDPLEHTDAVERTTPPEVAPSDE